MNNSVSIKLLNKINGIISLKYIPTSEMLQWETVGELLESMKQNKNTF